MSVVRTLIGNVKGPQGDTGAQGAQGVQGDAATITVGSVTSAAYGTPASVTNSGTTSEAVLDFVIPQGKPGEKTTKMGELTLDTITTSTDSFPSPAIDDTGAVAFGKIRKFFADTLSALAGKLDTSKVANNLTTTQEGYALDARQGKALNDSLGSTKISPFNLGPGQAFTVSASDVGVLVGGRGSYSKLMLMNVSRTEQINVVGTAPDLEVVLTTTTITVGVKSTASLYYQGILIYK